MHACTPSRKVQLTIEQKKTIRKYRDENHSISDEVIAQHFSIEWNIRLVRSTDSAFFVYKKISNTIEILIIIN
jgi:hypothetical protein